MADNPRSRPADTKRPHDAPEPGSAPAPAGEQLTRRQTRNSDMTEQAQKDPTGGAHSDRPDRGNP